MLTSAEYRDFAEYCAHLAERASPIAAKKLRRMAEVWLDLAASAASAPQEAIGPYRCFRIFDFSHAFDGPDL